MRVKFSLLLLFVVGCASKEIRRGKSISESLRLNSFLFKNCYQSYIDRGNENSIEGPVDLIFTFNDIGRVIKADVKYQKELDKDFKRCVREAIFEIPFPAPQKYKTVDVKQPFNFYIRE